VASTQGGVEPSHGHFRGGRHPEFCVGLPSRMGPHTRIAQRSEVSGAHAPTHHLVGRSWRLRAFVFGHSSSLGSHGYYYCTARNMHPWQTVGLPVTCAGPKLLTKHGYDPRGRAENG